MDFDSFIAIDWSGAEGRYGGISIARCTPGTAAPVLVAPESVRWTRAAAASWLEREIRDGQRLLIGFDFAFGMPFEPGAGYLAGQAAGARDIFALWDLIEAASGGEDDFGCGRVVRDPRFAPLYWSSGTMPAGWVARQRMTEIACATATRTRPETVFKLIGSKQVGKASLTGIRVLRQLRARSAGKVSIWPFEPAAGSVMVEIYPTLFRKAAADSLAKLRTRGELDTALRSLGSKGVQDGDESLSDHDTDALISAAGLRRLWSDGRMPLARVGGRIAREGWIFGVPVPPPKGKAA
jgi:hypothetical protein